MRRFGTKQQGWEKYCPEVTVSADRRLHLSARIEVILRRVCDRGQPPMLSATAVADARETTRAFLEALRQPAIDPEAAHTAVLVVSELVTNALRHGGGTYTLRLTAHTDLIEVAVDDPSSRAPRTRTPT